LDGCCPPRQQVKIITKDAGEGKKEETEMIGNILHRSTLFCSHERQISKSPLIDDDKSLEFNFNSHACDKKDLNMLSLTEDWL
jgi:hypothetical protein